MNKDNQFKCQHCGLCCHTNIWLYPFELKKAKYYAHKLDIKLDFQPLRKILDAKHQKIIVFIYNVIERPCPFYFKNNCLIYENKFIACRKYPIRSWIDLGKTFTFLGLNNEFYDVDDKCTFIKTHPTFRNTLSNLPISSILPNEYQAVLEDKKVWMELDTQFRILKKEQKIEIVNEHRLKNTNLDEYQRILNSWEQISVIEFLEYIKNY